MARSSIEFVCDNCSVIQAKYMGKCPNCGKYNSLQERQKTVKAAMPKLKTGKNAARAAIVSSTGGEVVPLKEIRSEDFDRIQLYSDELNTVLGGGLTPASVVLLGGSPGAGKCLRANTLVYTEDGMVEIGSLLEAEAEPGKFHPLKKSVLSSDGVRLSENVFKSNLEPMIELVTRNGYQISTTEDHALLTLSETGEYEWKKSKDINTDDYVAIQRNQSLFGKTLDFPDFEFEKHTNAVTPIFPKQIDEKMAYVLGSLIGDGTLGDEKGIVLTTPDEIIRDVFVEWIDSLGLKVSVVYEEQKHCYTCRCNNVALTRWLKFIGMPMCLSYNKDIPKFILQAPCHIVKSFIQGLFDTDGTVDKRSGYMSFSSVSYDLVHKLQLLILQFGVVSRLRKRKTNQGLGYAYNLDIYGENALVFNQRIGFKLPRKFEVTKNLKTNFNTNIDIVPYIPSVDLTRLSGSRGEAGQKRRYLHRYLSGYRKMSYTSMQQYVDLYPEFKKIYEDHFYWDQVKSTTSAAPEICYDLNVPTNSTFIANGIVSHNSTILSQIAGHLAQDETVLYASAEESVQQIKGRMDRMGISSDRLLLMPETNLEKILKQADLLDPVLLIVDSIQMIYSDIVDSSPGSITQVKECASILTSFAKTNGISTFIVSQMTKDDSFAGPRALEHIVDTTLYLEGDQYGMFRILRSIKNRFGAPEIGMFEMTSKGFVDVPNPSEMFLSERNADADGTTIAAMVDGSKAMLVEVQALINNSDYANPQRNATGFERNRITKLADILTKHVPCAMSTQNITVNVVGGIEGNEPAVDVPMAIAMLSSLYGKIVPGDTTSFGEIGLTGEIRSVARADLRIKEAKKIGMKRVIMPGNKRVQNDVTGIEIIAIKNVRELYDWIKDLPDYEYPDSEESDGNDYDEDYDEKPKKRLPVSPIFPPNSPPFPNNGLSPSPENTKRFEISEGMELLKTPTVPVVPTVDIVRSAPSSTLVPSVSSVSSVPLVVAPKESTAQTTQTTQATQTPEKANSVAPEDINHPIVSVSAKPDVIVKGESSQPIVGELPSLLQYLEKIAVS